MVERDIPEGYGTMDLNTKLKSLAESQEVNTVARASRFLWEIV